VISQSIVEEDVDEEMTEEDDQQPKVMDIETTRSNNMEERCR
jgi:hypothetical protein